jgi:hypothetical protein
MPFMGPAAGSLPVVLPGFRGDPVPVPAGRRAAFEAHLERVFEQAAAEWAPLLPARAETSAPTNGLDEQDARLPVLASACAFCGGACCRDGGDTAWIEVATVHRLLSGEAALDLDRLRAEYLAFLPAAANRDSCIYHGEHGCTLPRELRSNVCNQYACGGLVELVAAWKASGGRCLVTATAGLPPPLGRVHGDRIEKLTTPGEGP